MSNLALKLYKLMLQKAEKNGVVYMENISLGGLESAEERAKSLRDLEREGFITVERVYRIGEMLSKR